MIFAARQKKCNHLLHSVQWTIQTLKIINDILDLSKLEAVCLEMGNHNFNLRHAIVEVLDLVRERARMKQLKVRMDLPVVDGNHMPLGIVLMKVLYATLVEHTQHVLERTQTFVFGNRHILKYEFSL